MLGTNGATAADAGTVDIGGDITVNRLGFGAMRITGRGSGANRPIATRPGPCCSGPSSLASTSSTRLTPTAPT
jgi:hypothetical protein